MDPSHTPTEPALRIALLQGGNPNFPPDRARFARLEDAFIQRGATTAPVIYCDDVEEAVRRQLADFDAVLTWVNPVEDGRDRSTLDALLRDVAAQGIFVSSHPDVILQLGTKDVLYETRDFEWGGDTQRYESLDVLRRELPTRLALGARVLKQYRGNGGNGVWRVELVEPGTDALVRARHARRGAVEETMHLSDFYRLCVPYFAGTGHMIDQAWQARLGEGMIRCYLVHDRVEGFGLQAINALHPTIATPGPRLYYPPTKPEFQTLKVQLEDLWIPALQRHFGIDRQRLPILWDCDFLLGPKSPSGADSFVLCEINASCVSPFPDSAAEPVAAATLAACRTSRPRVQNIGFM